MTPEIIVQKQTVVTEKTVEYVTVIDDVLVYRCTTTTGSSRRKSKTTLSEGITSKAGLSAFRDGAVTMPPYNSNGRGALFVDNDFRDLLRTNGFLGDDLYKAFERLGKTPYTRFTEGSVSAADLVFVAGDSHMVYDAEGRPLPTAIIFTYIEAQMHNGAYDLEKALSILKARDDIRFVAENRWTSADQVTRIPAYNAERGRDQCLGFVWMPKVEDYRQMVAKCEEYGVKYPSTVRYQAVFDLDLLGLRAGGAARYETFLGHYDARTHSDSEEEEDY